MGYTNAIYRSDPVLGSDAARATVNIVSSTNATPINIVATAHGLVTGAIATIASHLLNTNANGTWKVTRVDANNFTLDTSVGNAIGGASGTILPLGGASWADALKTLPSAAAWQNGDVTWMAKSPDALSMAQNATFTNASKTVTLTTAVTTTVDDGEAAWTASSNVTSTADTTFFKENTKSAKHVIAAGFTTGLASYKAFSAVDYSAKQQITFWIRNSVAITSAGDLQVKLCSDNAGVTAVDTFNVPAIPSVNIWVPITVDKGSALGASIQSVALYVVTDLGAMDIYLDNIEACKASASDDALTLQDLIGKNSGDDGFFALQSIKGTTLKIDNHTNCLGSAGKGYSGTTETVTIYRQKTSKTAMASAASTQVMVLNDSGSSITSIISVEGGYNTSNDTQDGETFLDGLNGMGYGIYINNKSFFSLNKITAVRYDTGFLATNNTTSAQVNTINGISCTFANINFDSGWLNTITKVRYSLNAGSYNIHNFTAPLYIGTIVNCNNAIAENFRMKSVTGSIIDTLTNCNNSVTGFYNESTVGCIVKNLTNCKNNSTEGVGVAAGADFFIGNMTTSSNGKGVRVSGGSIVRLFNCSLTEATEVDNQGKLGDRTAVYSVKHDQTADFHKQFHVSGTIYSQTGTRDVASGIDWQFAPTSSLLTAVFPLRTRIAKFAVNDNALVTITARMQRSTTGLTFGIFCRGGQIAGVASDVTSNCASSGAFETVTLTFTPTETGVVEIEARAFGGTTLNGYLGNLTRTQA